MRLSMENGKPADHLETKTTFEAICRLNKSRGIGRPHSTLTSQVRVLSNTPMIPRQTKPSHTPSALDGRTEGTRPGQKTKSGASLRPSLIRCMQFVAGHIHTCNVHTPAYAGSMYLVAPPVPLPPSAGHDNLLAVSLTFLTSPNARRSSRTTPRRSTQHLYDGTIGTQPGLPPERGTICFDTGVVLLGKALASFVGNLAVERGMSDRVHDNLMLSRREIQDTYF